MGAPLHRQCFRQRHDGGKQGGRQHAGDEDRPEARHLAQQSIGGGGAKGAGDDHRPAALGEVGHESAQRNAEDAHRHHHGNDHRDLPVRQAPVLQPQGQEGQLDAAAEEQHGIEQRQPEAE